MSERVDEQEVFRFFDLPREMRDAIYDELRADKLAAALTDTVTAVIEGGPLPNLLTISKQFRGEYEERLSGTDTLTIHCSLGHDFELDPPQLTERLCQIPVLGLDLAIWCSHCGHADSSRCDADTMVRACGALMFNFASQLHHVQSVTVRIHLYRSLGYETPPLLSANHALSDALKRVPRMLTSVVSVKVFVSDDPDHHIRSSPDGAICIEWDAENGWQEYAVDAEGINEEDFEQPGDIEKFDGWMDMGGDTDGFYESPR